MHQRRLVRDALEAHIDQQRLRSHLAMTSLRCGKVRAERAAVVQTCSERKLVVLQHEQLPPAPVPDDALVQSSAFTSFCIDER